MKIDMPPIPPKEVKQGWEGQFGVFSWYNFAINIPMPVFLVTTLKENGLSNVQLSSWGMMVGSGKEPKFILQVHNYTDTYRLILKNKEFVISIPSYDLKDKFMKAIEHFGEDVDEIPAAGFTAEESIIVKVPRIKECFAHYECVVDWTRDLENEVKTSTLVQASIVHAAMDEEYMKGDIAAAFEKRALAYNASEFYNHETRSCSGGGALWKLDTKDREGIL